MSRAYLVLHGLDNHRPPAHWQFWLAARLAEDGHQVLYPDLPDPEAPSLAAWTAVLHDHLGRLDGDDTTVVCHSLACLLWFRAAASVRASDRPGRLLLVSPPAPERIPAGGAEFVGEAVDPEAVRRSVRGEIRVVGSDDDPFNPVGAAELYAGPLGVPAEVVPGAGHITPDSGYGPWPWVLQWATAGAVA